ncbi:cysteine desulfurase family protein [Rhizobium sp. L1K21]|uniref:cysteine desulfurase family protein n=1 Tax=Rhizobium sp. L1K21 TaxID=2954933 RepID=UPI002092693F|nr:cysteine desulfurase family protein [Rhizobium sp. L1K21]MCO6185911.1 cysteine desulfurase [Rhizobium sp. L1K21]
MRNTAYLDWNATAPLLPEAREAVIAALDMPGNASSVHRAGRSARAVIDKARDQVAKLAGASASNVIFFSGATEAANAVLSPRFKMGRAPLKLSKLYVSETEHPAILEGGRFERDDVVRIPVDGNGVVELTALAEALSAHDRSGGLPMVAVQAANSESGVVQPINAIARLTHDHGGIFVCDAVQAAGRMPLDIEALDIDFMILSAHKIGGPKGVGALVSRGEVMMPEPLVRGGGQEKGHRAGTENIAAIAGFGAAAAFHAAGLEARVAEIKAKRDLLEGAFKAAAADILIHGEAVDRLCNTSFFSLPGFKSETGQIAFDLEGIALSSGSACSSGKVGESHVLKAMGKDASLGALRISIGVSTTDEEIEAAMAAFEKINVRRLAAANAGAAA